VIGAPSGTRRARPQPPAIVFAASAAVAVASLTWFGRDDWFFNDDWAQWAERRSGASIEDPWRFFLGSHNGHWMTLNRVVFEGIYRVVGLHSYLPYLAWTIVIHVAAATVVWVVVRRAVHSPWVATGAGVVFLFLGAGAEVLGWADAGGFAAPLALGGAQLLLVDHDGPPDRRDAIGLGCALLSVMAGGPALVMLGVVTLSLVLRGRPAAIAIGVLPPALLWALWWWAVGRSHHRELLGGGKAGLLAPFVSTGVLGTLDALTRLGIAGVVAVALVGLVSWRGRAWRQQDLAPVAALAAGCVAFFVQAGLARAGDGVEQAGASRYLYVGAFLVLPLLAYGVDLVLTLAPRLRVAAVALSAWVLLSNLSLLAEWNRYWEPIEAEMRTAVGVVVELPGVEQLDPAQRREDPEGRFKAEWLPPVGVLVDLHRHGDLPAPESVSDEERKRWAEALGLPPP
jgi:hypothetical protein